MKGLHNLDLLRTFAVSMVLIDHTANGLEHYQIRSWNMSAIGVFGVYLFFVHTSLVLMWSLERQPNVLNFYIRRAFRIYPLAITAIVVALLFHLPVYGGGPGYVPIHFGKRVILSNLLLCQDLLVQPHGFTDGPWPNVIGVLWTLPIEVQMYVLLPFLFVFVSKQKKLWPLLVLWGLTTLEINAYVHTAQNILPTVIPDFLPGVIAYVAFARYGPRLPAWTFLPFLTVLLTVYMHRPTPIRSWPLMLAVGLMLPLFRQISNPGLVWFSQNVAKYSYGIYLWHLFGMKLSFHYVPGPAWLKVTGELVFTGVVSVATYHWIEEPLIRVGSRLAKREERREALAV